MDNEDLLAADVDVLVPAAMEGRLTAANAGRVRARFVVEGANGPTTEGADDILASGASSSCRTFWRTPAGWSCLTWSGCKDSRPSSGTKGA